MRSMLCAMAASVVLSVGNTQARAGTINVPADFATIPAAVAAAQAGDEIVVQPGVYDVSAGVVFPFDDIRLRGASEDPGDVILNGQGANAPIQIDQKSGIVIQAVTINGCATAVRISESQAAFDRCRVIDNTPVSQGSVVALESTLSITDCVFRGHRSLSPDRSGAVAGFASTIEIDGSFFSGNTAPPGASRPTSYGAALLLDLLVDDGGEPRGTSATVTDTVFLNNTSDFGAAIAVVGSELEADRCTFAGNSATYGGAVIVDTVSFVSLRYVTAATISNSVFTANDARIQDNVNGSGGAIGTVIFTTLTCLNNTFCYNTSDRGAGAIATFGLSEIDILNSIFAENGPIDADGYSGSVAWNLFGITAQDAGFADPLGPDGVPGTLDEDFSLLPGSPAIDAGNNEFVLGTSLVDYLGNDRFTDDPETPDTGAGFAPIVDLGATELDVVGPCNAADVVAPFETLDLSDITSFIAAFTNQSPPADVNNDGLYDIADIIVFVSAFTAGCP